MSVNFPGIAMSLLIGGGIAVGIAIATDSVPSAEEAAAVITQVQEARQSALEPQAQTPPPGTTGIDVIPGMREQAEAAGLPESTIDELFGEIGTHEVTDEMIQDAFGDLSDYGMSVDAEHIYFEQQDPETIREILQSLEGQMP